MVWEQMNVDKIPRGDLAYASRVEVLSLSRLSGSSTGARVNSSMGGAGGSLRDGGGYNAPSSSSSSSSSSIHATTNHNTHNTTTNIHTNSKRNLEEAERVLREALLSIKRPKLTYHALYLAYLKAGPLYMPKAQQLVMEMKERGIHPPDQIEVRGDSTVVD